MYKRQQSYAVAGAGLSAYLQSEESNKLELTQSFEDATNINLVLPLADYYALEEVPGKYSWFTSKLKSSGGELLYYLINYLGQYLINQPQEVQLEGVKYFEQQALNHTVYYIRYSAYQALGLLEDVPGVTEIKQRIKSEEKDPRLQEVYQQMP